MYVFPNELNTATDRVFLEDKRAHTITAAYPLGEDRWAIDVPDIKQMIQLKADERVQIVRAAE